MEWRRASDLLRRLRDAGGGAPRRWRAVAPLTVYEAVLTGLPGIGPGRARALIEAFGTPARAIEALTIAPGGRPDPAAVRAPGVGPGVRRGVRLALGLDTLGTLRVQTEPEPLPLPVRRRRAA